MHCRTIVEKRIQRNELPGVFFPQLIQVMDRGEKHSLDFYRFSKTILGYSKLGHEHLEWANRLNEVINIRKQRKLVLLKPRGTYKSTFYTVSFPIWMHLRNPNLRILIANAIEGNATKFLGEIASHYLRNENLAAIYRLRGFPGNPIDPNAALKKELRLTNCTKIQKEPVNHSTNKRARIEGLQSLTFSDALQPAIIRFRRDYETVYPLLIDQLLKFPNAAHEDALDALKGAVMLARRIPEADAEGAYLGGGGIF